MIVSDAVGAAAGGLVRDERNGLVVPAGDPAALAGAMRTARRRRPRCARAWAQAGAEDVLAYSHDGLGRGVFAGAGQRGRLRSCLRGAGSVRRS